MKIDSHQHFWHYDPVRYSWINDSMEVIQKDFLPEDLQPLLVENGFDGSILVQADQSEEETEFLLKLAQEYFFIKGVVGWIDLTATEVEKRLEHFSKNPFFKGVRHTVWDKRGEFMKEERFQKGISKLAGFDLAYDLLVFDYQIGAAMELVKRFPTQRFVLDHMGKPDISAESPSEEWKMHIRKLAENKNVSCKLSGLVTAAKDLQRKEDIFPFVDVVVESFGTDRIMFGSDWPVCLSAASFNYVLKIQEEYFRNFSKDEKRKIFGGNAARFYRL